jgi:CheY-like chemotaxis protein/anti-sigma regulatory factor (Ser/Thr protein kinase)
MSSVLVVEDDRATRLFLRETLKQAGFSVSTAGDGHRALEQLKRKPFDLMVLDVWLPRLDGLQVLARLRSAGRSTKVVVMTSDNTPETVLETVRKEAYHYLSKPVDPQSLVTLLKDALAAPRELPGIRVLSARPHWVELLVPCDRRTAERVESFLMGLKADLPRDVRESVGQVFREMLLNAIEWGGELDPKRVVKIAYLRARRMLMYRIADPGKGFRFEDLTHAAVANPKDKPFEHARVRREKGLRAGGFGILMAQALVDELLYNEAQNEVVFVKYLDR